MALPAPDLHIPLSKDIVDVSIIDTTVRLRGVHAYKFLQPSIKGHEYLAVPCYSFLIRHPKLNRSLVFDLGVRKDLENFSPALKERFRTGGYRLEVDRNVRDILEGHGIDAKSIEAVVWSHWHFDHVGDPGSFEPSTALIVGPGFKENVMPGYPANPDSTFLEADYAGRELKELSFAGSVVTIGRFPAIDYFGDGSFYFLDAPGHAVGHICALARVTSGPDSFIFMGGDAFHHMGEARPSAYLPLPETISPHPFYQATAERAQTVCPGALFEKLLPGGDVTKPFYEPARGMTPKMHYDEDETLRTVEKAQEADVHENILVVIAHDEHLLDVVDFFPKTANDFAKKGWVKQSRWKFLKDFAAAVGWTGELEREEMVWE